MKRYSVLAAIPLSLFSANLYRDIRYRWQGIGFSYAIVLQLVLLTPILLYVVYKADRELFHDDTQTRQLIEHALKSVTQQLPPMHVSNGEMDAEVEQPYRIVVEYEGRTIPLAVIDEEANPDDLKAMEDPVILLTRDAAHIRRDDGEIDSRSWSEFSEQSFYIDSDIATDYAQMAIQWAEENKTWIFVSVFSMAWALLLLLLFIYRIFQALIYGGVALGIASLLKHTLLYQDAVRIACVAVTPSIMFDVSWVLFSGEGLPIPVSILITVGFLGFALNAATREKDAKPSRR